MKGFLSSLFVVIVFRENQMALFEAYRIWASNTLDSFWDKSNGVDFTTRLLQSRLEEVTCIRKLDAVFPTAPRAIICNNDGKGTTRHLIFLPNADSKVAVDVRLTSLCELVLEQRTDAIVTCHAFLYDAAEFDQVIKYANLNWILDSLEDWPPLPCIDVQISTLDDLKAVLDANPSVPPIPPAAGNCTIC